VDQEHPSYDSHMPRRARAEHTFAHLKSYRVLRDCRRRGDDIDTLMLAVSFLGGSHPGTTTRPDEAGRVWCDWSQSR
jgi:hypothetical protein